VAEAGETIKAERGADPPIAARVLDDAHESFDFRRHVRANSHELLPVEITDDAVVGDDAERPRAILEDVVDVGTAEAVRFAVGDEAVASELDRAARLRADPEIAGAVFGERADVVVAQAVRRRVVKEILFAEQTQAARRADPDAPVCGGMYLPHHVMHEAVGFRVSVSLARLVRQKRLRCRRLRRACSRSSRARCLLTHFDA
jgi:hypothetical protein